MSATLTANEEQQLLQTIEMFEVITQSQPQDSQSLEILKEAYFKLGKTNEVVGTSKRIAEAYVQMGQLSSAILEYESILQRFPDDPDVQKALAEIENKATNLSPSRSPLETDSQDRGSAISAKARPQDGTAAEVELDDGFQAMQKIFVDTKLIKAADFKRHWPTPNPKDTPAYPFPPVIQGLSTENLITVEKALKLLSERTRLGYIPIEKYDVDIEFARTFPRDVCLRWCILPFDRLSKSIMVATANPYNERANHDLKGLAKGRLLWYLASPNDLIKILKKIFR
jgi:tetratricopeptide (TPR) repeat protein